jgi:hypothetical protein
MQRPVSSTIYGHQASRLRLDVRPRNLPCSLVIRSTENNGLYVLDCMQLSYFVRLKNREAIEAHLEFLVGLSNRILF